MHSSAGYFLHRLEPNSVEAEDALRCREPKISFGGLLDIEDRAEAVPLSVMEVCYSADWDTCIRSAHLRNQPRNQGNANQPSELPKNQHFNPYVVC